MEQKLDSELSLALSLPEEERMRNAVLRSGYDPGSRIWTLILLYHGSLDEIEAALDEANGARFIRYLRAVASETQFLLITHRRETMEAADVLYGVTMERQGVSRVLKLDLHQAEALLDGAPA